MSRGRLSACLPLALLIAGCDELVGLTSPAEDGGSGSSNDAPAGPTPDAPAPGDDAVGPATDASDTAPDSSTPPARAWPLPFGEVIGIAIAEGALYLLEAINDGVALYRSSLVGGNPQQPILAWSWTGYSTMALTAFGGAAYLGVMGVDPLNCGSSQILSFDGGAPTIVVRTLGAIYGLAADDTSVVWTQGGALLKHDFSDPSTSVTVLLTAPDEDSFMQVALDKSYVYAATALGALYAVSRDATDGGGVAIPLSQIWATAPLVATNGGVYFRVGGGPCGAGSIYFAAVGSPVTIHGSPFYQPPVNAFAIDGTYLYVASGTQLSYASLATLSPEPLLDAGSSNIVAGSGYVAFIGSDGLGLVAEEQP